MRPAALTTGPGGGPAILGGDLNLEAPETLTPGLERLAGGGVDYVLGRGFERVGAERLDAGHLSDHAPIRVTLRPVAARG